MPAHGTILGEIVRVILVGLCFVLFFVAGEILRQRGWSAENSRKLIHFGSGMVAISFPWVFEYVITLAVMAVLVGIALFVSKRNGWLPSLFGVDRRSEGEVYFPAVIVVLFYLAEDAPTFYAISLLSLAMCDSLAAVLGRAYGHLLFAVGEGHKSIEGTLIFMFSAFLVVHIPLLLTTDVDRVASVLIAVQLAILVASFEAVSTKGSDNVFVPLGTYFLLYKLTQQSNATLAYQLSVQLGILLIVLVVAARTRIVSLAGAIAVHLVVYAAFSLGGPGWIIAPSLAFVAFLALQRLRPSDAPSYPTSTVFHIAIVPIVLIFADNTLVTEGAGTEGWASGHPFHAPFVGAIAAAMAIVMLRWLDILPIERRLARWKRAGLALASSVAFVVPVSLWSDASTRTMLGFVTAAAICTVAIVSFAIFESRRSGPREPAHELGTLSVSVLIAVLLIVPIHLALLRGQGAHLS